MERRIAYRADGSDFEIVTTYLGGVFRTTATENGSPAGASRIQATAPADLREEILGALRISGMDGSGRPVNLTAIQDGMKEALRTGDPESLRRISLGGVTADLASSACRETRDRLDAIFGHPTRTTRMADLCWAVAGACDRLRTVREDGPFLLVGARERDVRVALARLSAFAGPDFPSLAFPSTAISADSGEVELRTLRRHAAITFSGLMGRQLKDDVYASVSRNVAAGVLSARILPTCLAEWRRRATATIEMLSVARTVPERVPEEAILVETADEFVVRMATRRGGPEVGEILRNAIGGDQIELDELHSIGSVLEVLALENHSVATFVKELAQKISLKEKTFVEFSMQYSERTSTPYSM